MPETENTKPHHGYAHGSAVIDHATVEKAVRRLIENVEKVEEKQKDGTVLVRHKHETDPPSNFYAPRGVKRPGPVPVLITASELETAKKEQAKILEHEHEVRVEDGHDLDVWAYHLARLLVTEARRNQARGLCVTGVVDHASVDGWVSVRVAMVL